ncbi:Universal stress protein family protein [Mucilaginibacter sp. OK268]|uniref:universal stress protein n=1 Tax=Mucilaginibacter sp. OK268 TaxID=1881048 RepID=UPI0008825113|nr:universal stress protein [Mucilaginibacter sp. OK268]SDP97100.1 Universal stress protein family protein [Mucilaginibacter sp. OK268]
MKTIIVLDDNAPADLHAIAFATMLARKIQAKIVICHTSKVRKQEREKVRVGTSFSAEQDERIVNKEPDERGLSDCAETDDNPVIEEMVISDFNIPAFVEMVNKDQVYMIIKGLSHKLVKDDFAEKLDAYRVLNRVRCPLMLIPESWPLKDLERLVYIADLRYCRLAVVRYLAELARSIRASLTVAHLSAKGLPSVMEPYAQTLFTAEIGKHIDYDQVFFNNIREPDLIKAVDVMINGMHNDLLVLVNHRFHFEQIIGDHVGHSLPAHITVPLIIFPY